MAAIRANAACDAPRPPAREIPPSGLYGMKAIPSSVHKPQLRLTVAYSR
ncbi:hypothetical protein ACGFRG_02345 [Streptomyces sp. NPDC048696]